MDEIGEFDHKSVVDNLFDGVYYVDLYRTIRYWNAAAEAITGFSAKDAIGTRCADNLLMHVDAEGRSLCQHSCPLAATMADGRMRETEVYLHHREGHRLPVLLRAFPMRDRSGQIIGAVEVFSDASETMTVRSKIEELEQLILIDPFTELGNRRMAEMSLRVKLDEFVRYGWSFAVLLVDIDRFKSINDEYGHDTGDLVIRMVARTLAYGSRRADTVARWGGDEFLIVMVVANPNGLADMTARLRRLVEESSLAVGDTRLSATVTIGAALVRPGDNAQALLARADELLYAGKAAGRNRVMFDTDTTT